MDHIPPQHLIVEIDGQDDESQSQGREECVKERGLEIPFSDKPLIHKVSDSRTLQTRTNRREIVSRQVYSLGYDYHNLSE